MNSAKKILRIAVPLIILVVLYEAACGFFLHQAFRPVKSINAPDSPDFVSYERKPYDGNDAAELLNVKLKEECYPWLKSVSQVVSIQSFDNLKLNAYFAVQPENHKYAVVMHGFHDFPKVVSPYAKHFYESGFNVLVPGQRGHGWSEGNIVDMSAFTCYDVKSWVEYICSFDEKAQIFLWGISMGGSTVMQTTGLDLPSNVLCCIEDCGFSSTWDEFAYQLEAFYHIPTFPVLNILNSHIKHVLGFDCRNVSGKKAVARSKIPTLFIHGTADTYVPFYMLDIVYEAANCPKQKLEIEGAVHARSAFKNPELYWSTVDKFLKEYFTL